MSYDKELHKCYNKCATLMCLEKTKSWLIEVGMKWLQLIYCEMLDGGLCEIMWKVISQTQKGVPYVTSGEPTYQVDV